MEDVTKKPLARFFVLDFKKRNAGTGHEFVRRNAGTLALITNH